jgi:hypothetical protein
MWRGQSGGLVNILLLPLFRPPHLSLDYASGDSDPNDNKLETYDPMYPLGQSFFGVHGFFDRRNLVGASFNLDFFPLPRLFLRVSAFSIWRAQIEDGMDCANE